MIIAGPSARRWFIYRQVMLLVKILSSIKSQQEKDCGSHGFPLKRHIIPGIPFVVEVSTIALQLLRK